ncbi:MAG: hypothetical protein EB072_10260 [Betaproteobacteria bacterium]|nr:hypothetical protein [Betaproteobacteria bacterium]
MIEVIETTNENGTNAVVVGGRKTVTITAYPAVSYPERRGLSDGRRLKAFWVPARFEVSYAEGKIPTVVHNYDRAVQVAVYHAKRA